MHRQPVGDTNLEVRQKRVRIGGVRGKEFPSIIQLAPGMAPLVRDREVAFPSRRCLAVHRGWKEEHRAKADGAVRSAPGHGCRAACCRFSFNSIALSTAAQ